MHAQKQQTRLGRSESEYSIILVVLFSKYNNYKLTLKSSVVWCIHIDKNHNVQWLYIQVIHNTTANGKTVECRKRLNSYDTNEINNITLFVDIEGRYNFEIKYKSYTLLC